MSNGIEKNVKWEIDDSKIDPVTIKVENIKSGKNKIVHYHCEYNPIWGYDVSDVEKIERILDGLIKEYS